jgi:hypothetical protein
MLPVFMEPKEFHPSVLFLAVAVVIPWLLILFSIVYMCLLDTETTFHHLKVSYNFSKD